MGRFSVKKIGKLLFIKFNNKRTVPAKLNAFNSGVQGKLYETYKLNRSFREERLGQSGAGLIQLTKNQ